MIDSDRDTCTVLATTENIWSDLRVYQGLSPMMRTLNGVRVKFLNDWGLYGTSLIGLLLFLSDGKNSIAKSVDIILLSDCLVSARVLASLLDRIISGGAVFGNICRLMTRYCSISVTSAQGLGHEVLS